MYWTTKVKSAFNNKQSESLFCDGLAVWLDSSTMQPLEHRFVGRSPDAHKSDIAVMVDMSKPVTRERMKELGTKFGAKHSVAIKQYRFLDREGNLIEVDPSCNEGGYVSHTKKW